VHEPRKLPVVLSPQEVARLLEAAPGLKYKAALSVAYGAGLRVSEVVALKVSDIDSKRMLLRVEQPQAVLFRCGRCVTDQSWSGGAIPVGRVGPCRTGKFGCPSLPKHVEYISRRQCCTHELPAPWHQLPAPRQR
jgi:hypothetical protein